MNSSMPENRGSTVSRIPGCIAINIETLGCDEDRWSQNHEYKRHTQPTGLSVAACADLGRIESAGTQRDRRLVS